MDTNTVTNVTAAVAQLPGAPNVSLIMSRFSSDVEKILRLRRELAALEATATEQFLSELDDNWTPAQMSRAGIFDALGTKGKSA